MAERLRTQAEVEGPGWLPLLEGGLLLTLILAARPSSSFTMSSSTA